MCLSVILTFPQHILLFAVSFIHPRGYRTVVVHFACRFSSRHQIFFRNSCRCSSSGTQSHHFIFKVGFLKFNASNRNTKIEYCFTCFYVLLSVSQHYLDLILFVVFSFICLIIIIIIIFELVFDFQSSQLLYKLCQYQLSFLSPPPVFFQMFPLGICMKLDIIYVLVSSIQLSKILSPY